MLYVYEISCPANTGSAAPYEEVIHLAKGKVVRAEISFPAESKGQLHVQVYDALHQVWPINSGASLRGDNQTIEIERDWDVDGPPYELTVKVWNDDDTYAHLCILRLLILPPEDPEYNLVTWLQRVARGMGYGRTWGD